jgi:hypothetical protein
MLIDRIVTGLLVILHHREYRGGGRGWRQQGRYVKSRLEKQPFFIVFQ